MKISIVVTVFSETYSLIETIERLLINDRGHISEIILIISPRSSPECMAICSDLTHKYSFLRSYMQKNNPGVGWAIRQGFELFTGDYVVLISADLETEPEAVARMIKKIEETGCDGVIGNRWMKGGGFKNYNTFKLVLNFFFQLMFRLLYWTRLGDLTYGYKILSRQICNDIRWEGTFHEIYIETTVKPLAKHYYLEQIPTIWIGRVEGKSNNSFIKNFRYVRMALKVLLIKQSNNRYLKSL